MSINNSVRLGNPGLICATKQAAPNSRYCDESPFLGSMWYLPKRFFSFHGRWNFNYPLLLLLLASYGAGKKMEDRGDSRSSPKWAVLAVSFSNRIYLLWATSMYLDTESKQCLPCKTWLTWRAKKKQQNKTKTTHKNQYELKHKQRVLITVLLSPWYQP